MAVPCGQEGFSLIEMLLVVTIVVIVSAIAIPVSTTAIRAAKADGASATALAALQDARARAIAERRNFQVAFVAPNIVRASREEPGGGTTVVAETVLDGQTFTLLEGVEPLDEFGADGAIHFTGPQPVRFTTDGSLIDASGDPVNGTIHLANEAVADSSRAVTVLGATGLMQTWKLMGTQWHE